MQNWIDLKIIIIGDSGTGKSSYVNKWTKNIFSDTYKATIVSSFGFKIFENDGRSYRIQLWDLAGQDKNALVTKIYAKDAHGVIIFSDAKYSETREDTKRWKSSVDEAATFLDGGKLPCILVENKCDLIEKNENENYEDPSLKEFAESNGFDGAFLASSKSGYNINESITFLINLIIKRIQNMPNKEIKTRKSLPLDPEKFKITEKKPDKTNDKIDNKSDKSDDNSSGKSKGKFYNVNDKFDNSSYGIDKIEFKDLGNDLIGICIYKDGNKIGYECEENFIKLKEKYEFLNWIKTTEKFIDILNKFNEKKKIKINYCFDKILIYISIFYAKLWGDIEEMQFILKYNEVEKEDLLDKVISEMIKMKENDNNSEDESDGLEDDKNSEKGKNEEKEKKEE